MIKVSVVMAFPDSQQVMVMKVSPHCTARQAVDQAIVAGLDVQHPGFDVNQAALGVYGIRVADDQPLQAGDRVEIYRQLQQDPMELRRQRAASEASRLATRRK